MAACVDKWNPTYSSCGISDAIYLFVRDSTTDRSVPAVTAAVAGSWSGSGSGCCCDGDDAAWYELRAEAQADAQAEPLVGMLHDDLVLSRPSLEAALAAHLAAKLCIRDLLAGALSAQREATRGTRADLLVVRDRGLLGLHALQAHPAAHALWSEERTPPALLLQSRASDVFPLHAVTLGGKGGMSHDRDLTCAKMVHCSLGLHALLAHRAAHALWSEERTPAALLHQSRASDVFPADKGDMFGDRHPKVGDGVLIGAGVGVLGNMLPEHDCPGARRVARIAALGGPGGSSAGELYNRGTDDGGGVFVRIDIGDADEPEQQETNAAQPPRTTDGRAELVERALQSMFCGLVPACATSHTLFKDGPDYVRFTIFSGLLFIVAVTYTGMFCRSRGKAALHVAACATVALMTFVVASQLSATDHVVVAAAMGAVTCLIMSTGI